MDNIIGRITETNGIFFQWEIGSFRTHVFGKFKSPQFSFLGYTRALTLLLGFKTFHISLSKEKSDSQLKRMICICAVMDADGKRKEIVNKIVELSGTKKEGDGDPKFTLFKADRLMEEETLIVTCFIEGVMSHSAERSSQKSELIERETLSSHFEDLFISKRKYDVTIKVRDKEFKAHKVVLLARSPVFDAMFEHDFTEKESGIVTVPDCDTDTFDDFLHHLYTGKFEKVSPVNAHHLYVTADKYDVQGLKSFCVEYLKENLTVENVCDVAHLADRYAESELMSSVHMFFNRNVSKILPNPEWEMLTKEKFVLANKLLMDYVQGRAGPVCSVCGTHRHPVINGAKDFSRTENT